MNKEDKGGESRRISKQYAIVTTNISDQILGYYNSSLVTLNIYYALKS